VPRSLLTLASIAGFALGCAYAVTEPAEAQRATPLAHPVAVHAQAPYVATQAATQTAPLAAPLVADRILFPVYPPAPMAYPLDADGHPVSGLDIGIEDLAHGTALISCSAATGRAW
jgi:hypothetical protein